MKKGLGEDEFSQVRLPGSFAVGPCPVGRVRGSGVSLGAQYSLLLGSFTAGLLFRTLLQGSFAAFCLGQCVLTNTVLPVFRQPYSITQRTNSNKQ